MLRLYHDLMTHPPEITTIRQAFAEQFAYWGIELPADLPPPGQVGWLYRAGWTIHYRLGGEDGQPRLDFYASHRSAPETLNRIHADGRYELLAQVWELYPEDDEAARRRVMENNRRFYQRLTELGLR